MPKPAPAVSSCVPTASAWPPSTCATATTTVETAATSSSVPPPWPVGPTISAVTPRSVCRSCGAATETPTALIVRMRGRNAVVATASRTCPTDGRTALLGSFAVPTGSVCGWPGSVMEIQTARTSLMSLTAVSSVSFYLAGAYTFSIVSNIPLFILEWLSSLFEKVSVHMEYVAGLRYSIQYNREWYVCNHGEATAVSQLHITC